MNSDSRLQDFGARNHLDDELMQNGQPTKIAMSHNARHNNRATPAAGSQAQKFHIQRQKIASVFFFEADFFFS